MRGRVDNTGGYGALLGTAVTTVTGAKATITVNGANVSVQVGRDVTLGIGDVVEVQRIQGVWVVTARLFTAAPSAPSNGTAPPTTGSTGTLVVAPVYTGTFRNSKWRTDDLEVIQGDWSGTGNNTGAVFYGTSPRSLSGATVTAATIQVRRNTGGNYAAFTTSMRLVTESTKPSGAPTLTSSSSGPSLAVGATNSSFVVPTAWAQAMVDGTSGGIGFQATADQSHYCKFAGTDSWGPAFTMSISWSR